MKYRITAIILGIIFLLFSFFMLAIKDKPATPQYDDIIKTTNDEGKEIRRDYVDSKKRPVTLTEGYSAYTLEYDSKGRPYKVTYLDKNGEPVKIASGYTIVLRFFDDADRIETEWYYDADRNPVMTTGGYYGVYFGRDENGRAQLTKFLDKDGYPVIAKMGYAMLSRTYDANGKITVERYLDQNGNPMALARGQYGVRYYKGKSIYIDKDGRDKFELMNFLNNYPVLVFIIGGILFIFAVSVEGKWNYVFLLVYSLFIVYMTLMKRDSVVDRLNLRVFWSYRQFFTNRTLRIEILDNIWMFIPLGAFLYNTEKSFKVLFIPVLVSILIEITQFVFGIGLCEIDDVISNGLGGIMGIIFSLLYNKRD